MLARRVPAFVDACALAGALKRNLLLTLAEADFFRLHWSRTVLDETQAAIFKILTDKHVAHAEDRAARARHAMERAFEEALVTDFARFLALCETLPDRNDAHVLAAALKIKADVIVTDNLKHFPDTTIGPLGIRAKSTDAFIADMIALDTDRAVAAIRRMRDRLKKPEKTARVLLLDMAASELMETVDALTPHVALL